MKTELEEIKKKYKERKIKRKLCKSKTKNKIIMNILKINYICSSNLIAEFLLDSF